MTTRPEDFYADQPEFTGNTVLEVTVPSGKLIVADSLCRLDYFNVEPPASISSGAGLDAWARLFASETNAAYAFVGNTCPRVVRQPDGALEVISTAWDEAEEPMLNDGETSVAAICTDMWATMLTDYQHWLDHGGQDISTVNQRYSIEVYTLIDVAPGKYRWTVYSHADGFDVHAEGRVAFARLELIEPF